MSERKTPVRIARPLVPLVWQALLKESYGSIPSDALAWAFSREGYDAAIAYVRNALLLAGVEPNVGSSGMALPSVRASAAQCAGEAVLRALKAVVEQMRAVDLRHEKPHFQADDVKSYAATMLADASDLNQRVTTFFAMNPGTRNLINEAFQSWQAGVVFKQVKKSAVGVGQRILDELGLVRPDGETWIDVTLAPPMLVAAHLLARFDAFRSPPQSFGAGLLARLDATLDDRSDQNQRSSCCVPPRGSSPPSLWFSSPADNHYVELKNQVAYLENQVANLQRQLDDKDQELARRDDADSRWRRAAAAEHRDRVHMANFTPPETILLDKDQYQRETVQWFEAHRLPANDPRSRDSNAVRQHSVPGPLQNAAGWPEGAVEDTTVKDAKLLTGLRRQCDNDQARRDLTTDNSEGSCLTGTWGNSRFGDGVDSPTRIGFDKADRVLRPGCNEDPT